MQTELWGQSCGKGAKSCLLTELRSTPYGHPCRTEQQQLSHGEPQNWCASWGWFSTGWLGLLRLLRATVDACRLDSHKVMQW